MMNRKTFALAAALLSLATAACSRSDDESVPAENYGEAADRSATPPADPVYEAPAPEPTPTATADINMAVEIPPEVAPAPDEQMMDDASATGMTARATRNEPAPDETGATEQIEKK